MPSRTPSEQPSNVLAAPRDFAALSNIRRWVNDFAAASGVRDDLVDDIVLAVSELATNTIQYSEDDEIVVSCETTDGSIIVDVSGADALGPLTEKQLPGVNDLAGRGLFIVQSIMDDVAVVDVDGRSFVRCTKRLT